MKRRLYLKLFGTFFVFAAITLIFLSTFTHDITENYLVKKQAQQLSRDATLIASDLKIYFSPSEIQLPGVQNEMAHVSKFLSGEIWIIDIQGNILLDSSDAMALTLAQIQKPLCIENFNISDFGNTYYMTGNFYDCFEEETLTVFSTITNNYKVQGYVLIHMPMEVALQQVKELVDITSLSVIIILLSTFLLIIAFTIIVYRPIRNITKIAEAYAKGDFSKQIAINSNDEIGHLANTLNYMATTLNTMEDEQRKFISNVSHDFRSPLTSIKGYIEAMLDGTIPVEMQEKYLNIILFETERLNKLTQNILDLNKFGHNGISLDISDFDINQLIRNTIMTFEGVCSKKGLSFDLYLTGQELFVKADIGKIQQVLYNLIDNATKFSHNNTAIIIETNIQNEKVLISVKDKGIGIPSSSIKKVWERFYKTDQSRGRDKKGSGLGLSIVKEIVQAHNENINVISTEGVGTEFIFTLPLSDKEN